MDERFDFFNGVLLKDRWDVWSFSMQSSFRFGGFQLAFELSVVGI